MYLNKPPQSVHSDGRFIANNVKGDFVTFNFIEEELADAKNTKLIQLEEERRQILIQKNIDRLRTFLQQRNSPLAPYSDIMVRRADECGGDWRTLVAIAGNESGLGRINYKLYNPFGYLDGVQYSGYEEALTFLSCRISQRFLAPCNNNLVCIINRYGGSDTNKEKWIQNVQWFINQL